MTIFVFGSNLLGIHKRGAAKEALEHWDALMGKGEGIQGSCYALPTKKTPYKSLTIDEVRQGVDKFIIYALAHPDDKFIVTRVGCGLAGFKDHDIVPLFREAPENCWYDEAWKEEFEWYDHQEYRAKRNYWGTGDYIKEKNA